MLSASGTALSGKHLIVALAGLSAVLFTGCTFGALLPVEGGGSDPRIDLGAAGSPIAGAPIGAGEADFALRVPSGRIVQPLAAVDDGIVLADRDANLRPDVAVTAVQLLNPATGKRRTLWENPAGRQSFVLDAEGDWLTSVDTGLALPFAEWSLVLRNVVTGEARTIASADPAVAGVPGLKAALPFGFAPAPSISGGRVAWSQYIVDGAAVRRELRLYDIATAAITTVAATSNAVADIEWPVLGGERLAWIERDGGGQATFVVRDIPGSAERRLRVPGDPFGLALSSDGRFLAWDDALSAKYSLDLQTGAVVRFAGEEGWGVFSGASAFSASPATAYGGNGGYYDTSTNTIRWLEPATGVVTNVASVFGPWFGWQESTSDGVTYYFVRSDGQGGTE